MVLPTAMSAPLKLGRFKPWTNRKSCMPLSVGGLSKIGQ